VGNLLGGTLVRVGQSQREVKIRKRVGLGSLPDDVESRGDGGNIHDGLVGIRAWYALRFDAH